MSAWAVSTLLWPVLAPLHTEAQAQQVSQKNGSGQAEPNCFLTNVVQFAGLSASEYLDGFAFRLDGAVTLVDTNRNLLVLQDATGALAVNLDLGSNSVRVGQMVTLEGTNCYPYLAGFPNYPYHPSLRDIRPSFEIPTGLGEYYLTRMRGYLHPPASGEYTFWIASDNSSELWLSTNEVPSSARKIASIGRFGWVSPHEWTKFPSQRSEAVSLEAGKSYYIEALQEQTTAGDNLSVAWQGPTLIQAVITNQFLTPWVQRGGAMPPEQNQGILFEYWTNFAAGDLGVLSVPNTFGSAISVESARIAIHGECALPKPAPMSLAQRLPAEGNYRWVEVKGRVKFAGKDGDGALLELSDGQSEVQVRSLHWAPELWGDIRRMSIRVEGVCEEVYDRNGVLASGLIWASAENSISLVEPENSDLMPKALDQSSIPILTRTDPPTTGFYSTRGVVTFNDRVFDKQQMYVQEGSVSVFVSLKDRSFRHDFKAGQWVELGGALQPGRPVPLINPLVVTELGWRAMPAPVSQPDRFPFPESSDGKWTEIEGVANLVHSNGTIAVLGRAGLVNLWIGQTPSNSLNGYVDARLRARGVLSLSAPDAPLLLVPSCSFVDVEEESPRDPFKIPVRQIGDLGLDESDLPLHRIRLVGEVTYRHPQSFVIQDQTGGAWVQPLDEHPITVGDAVEVVGFLAADSSCRRVREAMVRCVNVSSRLVPASLDLSEALSFKQSGELIRVSASLLGQKHAGGNQVLEVQEQRRVFVAMLPNDQGALPTIAAGSRIKITGICDNANMVLGDSGPLPSPQVGSLQILLRGPADVVILSGPPWWTLRRTVPLLGTLLAVAAVALLWVVLLRRRLKRQQVARLAFSRQILQGQESERQRIALNLHDSLGQNLLVIKNQACLAMEPATDEAARQQRLNHISEITSQAIEEIRQITHDLRPYQLDRLGLTQAIRATINRASESSSILFASHVDEIDGIFDKEAQIHVYRVIQEAINNILKHSGATEAAVVVKNQSAVVSLSIRDNGRGFDTRTLDFPRSQELGYGLSGMSERVRILGGSLLINSPPNQGTNLTVEIPKPISKP